MAGYSQATQEVARPSEVLVGLGAYVTFLQSLGHLLGLDTGRIIRGVLLQQTQPRDAAGEQTLTTIYTNWWAPTLPLKKKLGVSPLVRPQHPKKSGVVPFMMPYRVKVVL